MTIATPITKSNEKLATFQERVRTFGTYEKLDVDNSVVRVLDRRASMATVGATPGAAGTLWTGSIPADALTGRMARLRVFLPSFSTFTGDETIKVKVGGTYLATIAIATGVPTMVEVLIFPSKQVQVVSMDKSGTGVSVVSITSADNALTTTADIPVLLDYQNATNELNACTAAALTFELL